tara:strand:- start:175 stop:558 length:384 start_codon:yes stop_codon:yes gene_type:complete
MALNSKKYERVFSTTGSDDDLIDSATFNDIKNDFDSNLYIQDIGQFKLLGPALYQIQKLTEELDDLRTEISANKDNRIVIGSSTTISFGDMITTTTTDKKGNTVTTYTIVMTVTNGGVSKTTTLTLT